MRVLPRLAALALITAAQPATAQTVLIGDHSVVGDLCVGNLCTGSETFLHDDIKIKDFNVRILLEDTSTSGATRDWRLVANQTNGAQEYFSIEDVGAATTPFTISGGAPSSAIYVDSTGRVGLRTSIPQADLHITDGTEPALRLDQDGSAGFTPQVWDLSGNDLGFLIKDTTAGTVPVVVNTGAPNNAINIRSNGNVGFGDFSPDAPLDIERYDGTAMVRIEEFSSISSPRTLLNLQNNGRPEIVMGNSNTGGEWSFGAGTNFVLKQGAVGSASSAKVKVLTAKPNGDVTIEGSLTTGGPTCGSGCDAVFSAGYDLPSIAEHAEAMYALGHLPNVGPTLPGAPLNVSEKLGNLLNELEHAHIYIAKLEAETAARDARHGAKLAAQEARLAQLEALVQRLAGQP